MSHEKLKDLIVIDFLQLDQFAEQIQGYDASFFCAGISSIGLNEEKYRHITYDTTITFAKTLLVYNPQLSFTYVSGAQTDSSEKGRLMWARVKGKTENELAKLPFASEYNFRPGVMAPFPEQKHWKHLFKFHVKIVKLASPKSVLTLEEVGHAMINAVTIGYAKNVLEMADIRQLAKA